jgi:glycerol-3-phosphate dehydrogenase
MYGDRYSLKVLFSLHARNMSSGRQDRCGEKQGDTMTEQHPNDKTPSFLRGEAINALATDTLDLLIIGGGITGAGAVRDAAMRGLRAGLVEQHDFAFGSSSRSARLLHGGIRYLAQGNIRLVRQASLEKVIVHRIAPHIAEPLPFLFPTYKGTPWPKWQLRIGVKLYDMLCSGRNLGKSRSLSVEDVRNHLPGITEERLTGGVRYFDGLTNDARLVIDTLRSAVRNGAFLCNYCKLEEAHPEGDTWVCGIRDIQDQTDFSIRTRCVVNAAGAWADKLNYSQVKIRGTKGIHLIVDRATFPIPDEAVMMTEQKRVVWAIPWGEKVYVGCTDTDYKGALEDVCTDPKDIHYILDVMNRFFPALNLTESDVLTTWAGVRPLVADDKGRPSEVSRSHFIKMAEKGWIDAAGGKLTTYRLIAQEIVDKVGRYINADMMPCRTAAEPLLESRETEGVSSVIPPPVTRKAVEIYCRREWAVHLKDVMIRRSRWHYYHKDRMSVAEMVASWMADLLGWTDFVKQEEIQHYCDVRD